MMNITLYIYIWLALFGACIGSFLNVVIYRLPKGNFLSKSRSFCSTCEKSLKWRDLIPIISWLSLKGRCRYCNTRISLHYPIVEATCAFLGVICFLRFGIDLKLIIVFFVTVILFAISLIDFNTFEIPNSLLIAIIPFSTCAIWVWYDILLLERIIGFFIISLPMLLLALIIEGAFGGGDIKLMAVCGFLLGWKNTLLAFFIALLLCGIYVIYLLIRKRTKRGEHIAFGPYLCTGIVAALFYGTEIINFYLNLFI